MEGLKKKIFFFMFFMAEMLFFCFLLFLNKI
jgi:hypothetical protein